jgi:hypothetical protein
MESTCAIFMRKMTRYIKVALNLAVELRHYCYDYEKVLIS